MNMKPGKKEIPGDMMKRKKKHQVKRLGPGP
jgi:hypothetical protein